MSHDESTAATRPPLEQALWDTGEGFDAVWDEWRKTKAVLAAYRRAFIADSQDQGLDETDAVQAADDLEELARAAVS